MPTQQCKNLINSACWRSSMPLCFRQPRMERSSPSDPASLLPVRLSGLRGLKQQIQYSVCTVAWRCMEQALRFPRLEQDMARAAEKAQILQPSCIAWLLVQVVKVGLHLRNRSGRGLKSGLDFSRHTGCTRGAHESARASCKASIMWPISLSKSATCFTAAPI